MNKYFALRKTNRMRTELLTEKSQEQLKEVIRYLRRVSFRFTAAPPVFRPSQPWRLGGGTGWG